MGQLGIVGHRKASQHPKIAPNSDMKVGFCSSRTSHFGEELAQVLSTYDLTNENEQKRTRGVCNSRLLFSILLQPALPMEKEKARKKFACE
ncbi:hypothetical protein ACTL6U_09165 [Rhodovibrionaceae bacterium A322]